jgi:hypothetical protein
MLPLLFEFILKLLEQASKLLKSLPLPPKVAAVVSLLPPLIGVAQVSWKFLQDLSGEHKKKVLRERVLGLQNFLKSFSEAELSDEQTRATQDARREQAEAIGELARLAPPVAEGTSATQEAIRKRNWIRNTLLLYSPKPRAVWILHGLFYFFLLELLALMSVLAGAAATGSLETAGEIVPAVAVFAVPVLVFWGLASDLDRSGAHGRGPLQRWLLLYVPERRWRWLWHVLFYISLLAVVSVLGLLPEAIRSKDVDVLSAVAVWLLLALIFRKVAVRQDRNERKLGRLQRWLLLYAPRRRWVWLLHILFWAEVLAIAVISISLLQEALGTRSVTPTDAVMLLYCLTALFIFWGLASDVEQARQGPPEVLRRVFLLYMPDRRLLWTLHILFYLSVLTAVAGLVDVTTGQFAVRVVSTTTGEEILTTPAVVIVSVLYFVLIALVSRTLAVGLEPWGTKMPPWITWFWLGHLPRGWLRRSGFLLATLVFCASAVLWPLLVLDAVDDLRTHEGWRAFMIPLSVVGLGLAGRWVARRLQAKASEGQVANDTATLS